MKYDKPLLAFAIGLISTIPAEIFSRLLVHLGIGEYSLFQLGSLIITINRPSSIITFIAGPIVGGIIAVVFYYSLNKLGTDYLVIKAMVLGLIAWSFFEMLLTAMIEGKFIPIRLISDYVIHFLSTLIFYGATLGFMFIRFLVKKTLH